MTYWRVHPNDRSFGPDDATSTTWTKTETRQGYSCFDNPWYLLIWLDVSMVWGGATQEGHDVIEFTGRRVGEGADGEDLVIPDGRMERRMELDAFERELLNHPLPDSPKKGTQGRWGLGTWAGYMASGWEENDERPFVKRMWEKAGLSRTGSVRTAARPRPPQGYSFTVGDENSSSPPGVLVQAFYDGVMVGNATFHRSWPYLTVWMVWVDDQHQRKGLATQMVWEAHEYVPDLKVLHGGFSSDEGAAFAETMPPSWNRVKGWDDLAPRRPRGASLSQVSQGRLMGGATMSTTTSHTAGSWRGPQPDMTSVWPVEIPQPPHTRSHEDFHEVAVALLTDAGYDWAEASDIAQATWTQNEYDAYEQHQERNAGVRRMKIKIAPTAARKTATTAPEGVKQELWDAAGENAGLGVGHVWTNTSCPAYKTLDPADCNCNAKTAASKTATYYCNTHEVYVGDGNRDTHAGCSLEQRKSEETKAAEASRRQAYQTGEFWSGKGWNLTWHGEYGDGYSWAVYRDEDVWLDDGVVDLHGDASSYEEAMEAIKAALTSLGLTFTQAHSHSTSTTAARKQAVGDVRATCKSCGQEIVGIQNSDEEFDHYRWWHSGSGSETCEGKDSKAAPEGEIQSYASREFEAAVMHRAERAVKVIVIKADKTVEDRTVTGFREMQAIVGGLIQPIDLKDGSTLWVNEEFLYSGGEPNWIASDVAGLGGRPEFMLRQPILGDAFMTGGADEEGETLDVTESGRRLVQRVKREAGGPEWKKARLAAYRTAAADTGTCQVDSGSMYGNQPICSNPSEWHIQYRLIGMNVDPLDTYVCDQHHGGTLYRIDPMRSPEDSSAILVDERIGASKAASTKRTADGPWKAQMAGVGEMVWSGNGLTFATEAEAKSYAQDLLMRWTGADMARVVPAETPVKEPVDMNDPAIVLNYRTASRTAAITTIAANPHPVGSDAWFDFESNPQARTAGEVPPEFKEQQKGSGDSEGSESKSDDDEGDKDGEGMPDFIKEKIDAKESSRRKRALGEESTCAKCGQNIFVTSDGKTWKSGDPSFGGSSSEDCSAGGMHEPSQVVGEGQGWSAGQHAAARSDYDHWNEDADYMWWQEEGRHTEEESFDEEEWYEEHDASLHQAANTTRDDFLIATSAFVSPDWAEDEFLHVAVANEQLIARQAAAPEAVDLDSLHDVDLPTHVAEVVRPFVREAMPAPAELGVKVGDFFYISWGYDQTNVNFFEVIRLTGAGVEVKPVASEVVSGGGPSENVVPVPGAYTNRNVLIGMDRESKMCRLKTGYDGRPAIALDRNYTAWLWDGTPKHQTGYGFGH